MSIYVHGNLVARLRTKDEDQEGRHQQSNGPSSEVGQQDGDCRIDDCVAQQKGA